VDWTVPRRMALKQSPPGSDRHPEGRAIRREGCYAAPFQRPKGSVGVGRTFPPHMNA